MIAAARGLCSPLAHASPGFAALILAIPLLLGMDHVHAQTTPPAPREIRVDPQTGSDTGDGLATPVKTIARALKLAAAGATVHLAPGRYQESAVFANHRGEPGRPITLDGHGAILDGAEPLNPADWQMTAPGLYRHDHVLRMDPAILGRWFFVFGGKMNRMGRTSKGPSAALKQPEALAAGEWTYVPDAPITRETTQLTGAFFIKIDPEKNLSDYRIRAPLRSAACSSPASARTSPCGISRQRTFTTTASTSTATSALWSLKNIAAIDCGDDGFQRARIGRVSHRRLHQHRQLDRLCDVGTSHTHYRNLFIRGCHGYDVFFTSRGVHSIENALVESSAARAVSVGPRCRDGRCLRSPVQERARAPGRGWTAEIRIGRGAKMEADRCTFANLMVQATPGSEVNFQRCLSPANQSRSYSSGRR